VAQLFRNAHLTVENHVALGYIRVARSSAPFTHIEQATAELHACERSLSLLDVSKLGLLLDWRLAPLSTDARLHQAMVTASDAFARRFARRALLIDTPLGKLQSGRVNRTLSSVNPEIFNDEAAAIAFVSDGARR
jgi:hypothetical protein